VLPAPVVGNSQAMQEAGIQNKIARHLAFWNLADAEQPLVGAYVGSVTYPVIYEVARDGDWLEPAQLRPDAFYEYATRECEKYDALDSDLITPVSALYGVPWFEACLGMRLQVQGETIWAHQVLRDSDPLEMLTFAVRDEWVEALQHTVRRLAEHFRDRYPVALPFLRGPADVVASMIGTARFCTEFYDHPAEMLTLINKCANVWRKISTQLQAEIRPWNGGFVTNGDNLYTPGPCSFISQDTTTFVSMQIYRRFFLPADQVMSAAFPYGYIHRHSVSRHNMLGLLATNPRWAIEVTMDPTGPRLEEMLPLLQELQKARRPLIIFGLTEETEVRELVRRLSPKGLCVIVQADTVTQAQRLMCAARS
jgi:hypothetical protein